MNTSPVPSLDDLANHYAARWSAQRPAPEPARPATRPELRATIEANEVFLYLTELLPARQRCGFDE